MFHFEQAIVRPITRTLKRKMQTGVRFQTFTIFNFGFNFSFECYRLYDVQLKLKYDACFTLYSELYMTTWKRKNICNL